MAGRMSLAILKHVTKGTFTFIVAGAISLSLLGLPLILMIMTELNLAIWKAF